MIIIILLLYKLDPINIDWMDTAAFDKYFDGGGATSQGRIQD